MLFKDIDWRAAAIAAGTMLIAIARRDTASIVSAFLALAQAFGWDIFPALYAASEQTRADANQGAGPARETADLRAGNPVDGAPNVG